MPCSTSLRKPRTSGRAGGAACASLRRCCSKIETKSKFLNQQTMKTHITLLALAVASLSTLAADVTNAAATNAPEGRRGRGFGGPIELKPDDKPAFPDAPEGFDKPREGIAHGKLERVDYESKTVGVKRWMQVYTPPAYSKEKKYPVLYLLHG